MTFLNKIALGTAQFGLSYGIANKHGQVSEISAIKILNKAFEEGVRTLDTAILYGNSEQCLGNIGVRGWDVITKLPEYPYENLDIIDWVNSQMKGSLKRLNVDKLKAVMLHNPKQLLEDNGIELWNALQKLKNSGVVNKIGYSIYDPEQLNQLWMMFKPDIIQVPFNIVDQRIKRSGWLEKMHDSGVEVHVRSVFLQGLLLMGKNERPKKFDRWRSLWDEWEVWLSEKRITPLEACINFVNSEPCVDAIVVGVDSLQQLEQILSVSLKDLEKPEKEFIVSDEKLINPYNWGYF